MSCDRSRLYVISDGFCRTISYFSALATGIACLSYLWITDCTSIGKLNPTDSYLLQAGYSTYHQRVVERCDVYVIEYILPKNIISIFLSLAVVIEYYYST